MITLVIARHGNTFEDGQTATYVGARTDLPLTAHGREQAAAIGHYLKAHRLTPDQAYCSHLQRTRDTAALALEACGAGITAEALAQFNEVDYGPDENQPRETVVARIGEKALNDWEHHALVPPDWLADPQAITAMWNNFAEGLKTRPKGNVLVVTSNGVARFALSALVGDARPGKLATGHIGILRYDHGWTADGWGIKP